jgi:oligopeptide transport system substrate-binding protein
MRNRLTTLLFVAALAAFALLLAGCGGGDDEDGGAGEATQQVITVNWGTEPPSLDPGLASDTTSANILNNVMDPLVKLGDDLEPVPSLAESWRLSNGGRTVTFNLRQDGRWTNGDPVTAHDFEFSWKRTISPALAADYAYQFFGIAGAQEFNECEGNCGAKRDAVGVRALDDYTLEVRLTTPQPWFVQQMAHHSFLAVHRETVEQFGDRWTEASNIVTNGPFRLAQWQHDSRIDLAKWAEWRNADQVTLQRVNGRMITDGTTAVQAFEAGEIDATLTVPPEAIARWKGTDSYQNYPSLGTYYYGVNVKQIPDVNQRRAMGLAIDRRTIIDNVAQGDQIPATGYTPQGMPGFETINPGSSWLPESANLERAQQLMSQVANPVRGITLFYNESPAHQPIAVAVQAQWKKLGLDVRLQAQEWAQYLEFIGPPPNRAVDVFRLGWIGDYVDAFNFLEMWTCGSGNNSTNYCNPRYDRLVNQARRTVDDQERYAIYAELEQILFGEDGDMPVLPIYWYTFQQLENPSIKDTFEINLLSQIDLTEVVVEES